MLLLLVLVSLLILLAYDQLCVVVVHDADYESEKREDEVVVWQQET